MAGASRTTAARPRSVARVVGDERAKKVLDAFGDGDGRRLVGGGHAGTTVGGGARARRRPVGPPVPGGHAPVWPPLGQRVVARSVGRPPPSAVSPSAAAGYTARRQRLACRPRCRRRRGTRPFAHNARKFAVQMALRVSTVVSGRHLIAPYVR